MKIVSDKILFYVLRDDTGFAPNPYYGYCTLATCRSDVRKYSRIGQWVIGIKHIRGKSRGKLVFAMQVDEKIKYCKYYVDSRFNNKKPALNNKIKRYCGDNIYYKDDAGTYRRDIRSLRHKKLMKKDLKCKDVLVSVEYCYCGDNGRVIPKRFNEMIPKFRERRNRFSADVVNDFFVWFKKKYNPGIYGDPIDLKISHISLCDNVKNKC